MFDRGDHSFEMHGTSMSNSDKVPRYNVYEISFTSVE